MHFGSTHQRRPAPTESRPLRATVIGLIIGGLYCVAQLSGLLP